MSKHTMSDLYQMQSLPLKNKIDMTCRRIQEWYDHWDGDVYISFSGGKDSTVLLDLVRNKCGLKDVPAMFVDVPTQYPELREFAKTFDNVDIVRPKISFMEVCKKYGFPIISKEVSECVDGARKYMKSLDKYIEQNTIAKQASKQAGYGYYYDKLTAQGKYSKFSESPSNIELLEENHLNSIRGGGINTNINTKLVMSLEQIDTLASQEVTRGGTTTSTENYETLEHIRKEGTARAKMLFGVYPRRVNGVECASVDCIDKSAYSQEKYKFFLDAPFEISNKCCNVMKKAPAHNYYKQTGRKPIIATMASESRLRTQKWLQNGCNGFELKIPTSNPMSFWTEQDVLLYIKLNNLPICSVYGDVVVDYEAENNVDGQINMSELSDDFGVFDLGNRPLKTTGCNRTGCVLCGFGCHLDKEPRFLMLKDTHPKLYGLLDVIKNNGVTYRQALEWINEHGNMNIRF